MTELEVFAQGKKIGTAEVEWEGLFLEFSANLRPEGDALLRLYAVAGWHSEYLGIPCPSGGELRLSARLPASHFPGEPTAIVADPRPRSEWLPWCGELDGIPVRDCRIRREQDAIVLALAEPEAEQFPGWLAHMEEAELGGEAVRLLRLNADGSLPFSEEEEEKPEDIPEIEPEAPEEEQAAEEEPPQEEQE